MDNSEQKFAGSVTFGKAPNPKTLPLPKFIQEEKKNVYWNNYCWNNYCLNNSCLNKPIFLKLKC